MTWLGTELIIYHVLEGVVLANTDSPAAKGLVVIQGCLSPTYPAGVSTAQAHAPPACPCVSLNPPKLCSCMLSPRDVRVTGANLMFGQLTLQWRPA